MNNHPAHQALLPRDFRSYIIPAILAAVISLLPWPDIILSGTRGILLDREVYTYQIVYRDNLLNYFHFFINLIMKPININNACFHNIFFKPFI